MEKKYLAKIIANDNEGLQTISACCSGAKIKISNIKYLKSDNELLKLSKEKGVKFSTSVVDSIFIGAVFFTPIFFFAPQPINANIKKK